MRSTRGTPRLRCVAPTAARVRRLLRRCYPTPSVRVRGHRPTAQHSAPFDIAIRPDVRMPSSVGASSLVASRTTRCVDSGLHARAA
jgi:hypothetical protein